MTGMTSIDTILESVGINRQDLTTQVSDHRRMSGEMQIVLASHFPVEDLACAVEQLAARLTAISDEMSHNIGDYYVGGLAEDVIDMVNDSDRKDVLEIVRVHLALPAADGQGSAPILNIVPIFGHPDLRCVTQTVLNLARRTFDHSSFLINVNTGVVSPVPPEQTAVETAALLAQEASDV